MKPRRPNTFYGKDHVISTKPRLTTCPSCKGTMYLSRFDAANNKCYEVECSSCDNGYVER